jgi:DNA repair exonuclease SbcCD ATPase subunit
LTREQVEKEFILQEIERLKREDDPAALRAKIEALERELESHAWEISPAMVQAKIDELNAKDEALEKENARLNKIEDALGEAALALQDQLAAMQARVKELEEALAGKPVILTEWQQLQARCQVLEKGFADQTAIRERRETGFTETIAQLQAQLAAMEQERDDAVDKREGAYMRLDGMRQERDRLREALNEIDEYMSVRYDFSHPANVILQATLHGETGGA